MGQLEDRAREFATRSHAAIDQHRRYTGDPYITHPAAVTEIVRGVTHTEEMLAAAWLHDTVEDTAATLDEVEREFGPAVATLVEALTNVSRPEDGERSDRKALDLAHIAKAPPAAKTVKLADVIDNTRSILERDRDFARVYIGEKAKVLRVLREGDAKLYAQASRIVRVALASFAAEDAAR